MSRIAELKQNVYDAVKALEEEADNQQIDVSLDIFYTELQYQCHPISKEQAKNLLESGQELSYTQKERITSILNNHYNEELDFYWHSSLQGEWVSSSDMC